eukprot:TRINITY_DN3423_c0_g2_i3.p1 TRINITY_DN3423_c0_g2~~TRINITY_DN3423_c0_g2_i3.p1  ORF type:complete len:502 (+),score=69.89 TRINITY_DN3423_c0_g2_i3:274-1779(+)
MRSRRGEAYCAGSRRSAMRGQLRQLVTQVLLVVVGRVSAEMALPAADVSETVAVCIAGLERTLLQAINKLAVHVLLPWQADSFFFVQTTPARLDMVRGILSRIPRMVHSNVTAADSMSLRDVLMAGHAENMTWIKHLFLEKSDKPYGALQVWRRWFDCHSAVRDHEEKLGRLYDYIAYTRTDLMWYGPAPMLRMLGEATGIYCPSGRFSAWALEGEEYAGVNDRFLLVSRVGAASVGTGFWGTVSTFSALNGVYAKLIAANFLIWPNHTMGVEVLANWILIARELCILKFSSVAALITPDGTEKFPVEYLTANFFATMLHMEQAQWEVIQEPFLVGAKCDGLAHHCCVNVQTGGGLDCWLWYRTHGLRLYSLQRCCSAIYVHVAPVPHYDRLVNVLGEVIDRTITGVAVNPEVSHDIIPYSTHFPGGVPDHGSHTHWWCLPCQPEDCIYVLFEEEHVAKNEIPRGQFFKHSPLGFLQCYNMDHLLSRREGPQNTGQQLYSE